MKKLSAYDRLMLDYYSVLNNAWKKEIKDAARSAIIQLSGLSSHEKVNTKFLNALFFNINEQLGSDFVAAITKPTKLYIDKCFKYGLGDAAKDIQSGISIGTFGATDAMVSKLCEKQQLFWIGEKFGSDMQPKFQESIKEAISNGARKHELAEILKTNFSDIKRSDHYWLGLAKHNALKVREFGRLEGYRKAGAKGYTLGNPLDEITSDICVALVSQGLVYPLDDAIEIRDNLLAIDPQKVGLEKAREEIKALAPWVKEKDIVRDTAGDPIGVNGAHTPIPPFHWECRTYSKIAL